MKLCATSLDSLILDQTQAIRQGQVVVIEEHQGIIIDDNGQDIAFDVLECVETIYVGANISFCIVPSDDGLRASKISLLYSKN